ncbi:O-antigen ligase family protein [Tundrisphaera lichenicola]|uniref:O-antigen ligase family protein n=1 Tax=Tundrisphaera lichenicola TaxID=2029860 RepID=UPI003EBDBD7C
MLTLRIKLLNGLDRALAIALTGLLLGTALAFGGAVWWARPVIAAITWIVVLAWVIRVSLAGPWRILKSPLSALGFLTILLGTVQLLPIPVKLAGQISPTSTVVASYGVIPSQALIDDPSVTIPPPFLARSPLTLDRPATLRWLAGATVCLAVFWVVSHYSDRLGKAQVIWGSIVAAFFVNSIFGAVQVSNHSGGLYGIIAPGSGPSWAPTLDDAMTAPAELLLRPIEVARLNRPSMAAALPSRPFLIGSLMGGPGALLALGSLALPLALGMILQMFAPRGTRDGLLARLRDSGQGSLVLLMLGLIMAGSVLVGVLAGPFLSIPFAIGLGVAGLPGAWSSGARRSGLAATALTLLSLGGGLAIGEASARGHLGPNTLPRLDWASARSTWTESVPILREFPIVGTGLGTFEAIYPYYKGRDASSNTAMSSILQFAVESGAVGLGLLATAALWCLIRLPGAIRRVGTADRALAFGLLGSMIGFGLFSAIHWSVELAAVALAAAAVAGTANRWLAGGTDLFVDHG